ncbi:MAG: hypothetical protein V1811_01140, partial [Candidatus Micrarchaeota archaeon]
MRLSFALFLLLATPLVFSSLDFESITVRNIYDDQANLGTDPNDPQYVYATGFEELQISVRATGVQGTQTITAWFVPVTVEGNQLVLGDSGLIKVDSSRNKIIIDKTITANAGGSWEGVFFFPANQYLTGKYKLLLSHMNAIRYWWEGSRFSAEHGIIEFGGRAGNLNNGNARTEVNQPIVLTFKPGHLSKTFALGDNTLDRGTILVQSELTGTGTGCFSFKKPNGEFTNTVVATGGTQNTLNFEVMVRPLCGVCNTPDAYPFYDTIVYSFARTPNVRYEQPLVVRCDADVIFMTDFGILNKAEVEPSLKNWIYALRAEGKGVWVVDLNDEKTMGALAVPTASGMMGLGLVKTTIYRAINNIENTKPASGQNNGKKYLVFGGGVDVIPMPESAEYTAEEVKLNPLNDYCYIQNAYTGGVCTFIPGDAYLPDVVVARMLTEKALQDENSLLEPVKARLLVETLETATNYR